MIVLLLLDTFVVSSLHSHFHTFTRQNTINYDRARINHIRMIARHFARHFPLTTRDAESDEIREILLINIRYITAFRSGVVVYLETRYAIYIINCKSQLICVDNY